MVLTLARALRLELTPHAVVVAFVGAGGKTTAMFKTARELKPPVIVTATSRLGTWQIPLADKHIVAENRGDLRGEIFGKKVTLITGRVGADDKTDPVNQDVLNYLHESCITNDIPLLIEADGSHQKPLKAPKSSEPPIPDFADIVILAAGMSALGKPLTDEFVHRAELFSKLSGLNLGERITGEAITKVLTDVNGGHKNIPAWARSVALLNQADTPELKSQAGGMVHPLLHSFESVVIASLLNQEILAAHERVAGIILAAGGSTRYGQPKQLLNWHGNPFVRATALTSLEAGLSQVVVVTGANAEQVEAAVQDLPVTIARNDKWKSGQASSIAAGLDLVSPDIGSAIFFLADQPHVTPAVVRALIETHASELNAIVAPLVQGERRANPVLFDRCTFPDLKARRGDTGGRMLFSKYHVEYLPWHDDSLLLDVDKPEDYERLLKEDLL